MSGRIEREKDCVAKMVGIYCHDMHGTRGGALCEECRKLLDYADVRIDKCVFGARKSTCAKCAIHCYKKDMRAKDKRGDAPCRAEDGVQASRVVPAAFSGRV